jgi:DNA-directed RNA polymerase specialized sigma24 family protein
MDEDSLVTRRLTTEQQKLAESALQYVPVGVAAFIRTNPSYRRMLRHCDLESTAQLAVVQASLTYDPSKSQPQTYYGAAIRHALLKEVRRAKRSREGDDARVNLPKALGMVLAGAGREEALRCLETLPPYSRSVVQRHVLHHQSMAQIGREDGVAWQTVKARLTQAFDQLAACVDASSGSTLDSQEPSP